jgi:hypothetical protein
MKTTKTLFLLGAVAALAACTDAHNGNDKTRDYGIIGSNPLTNMTAGIWVDPRGCDHWIIHDGVEGYLSQRLDDRGKPVCSGIAPPEYAIGPFKGTQDINDPI